MTNRTVTVVVGLAAGSEGKGKFISVIAPEFNNGALVRTGGPNAAHTVIYNGEGFAFHQIPCGSLHAPNAKLVFGAGAQLDLDILWKEINLLKKLGFWSEDRLIIDPQATIIDTVDKVAENGGAMPACEEIYFRPRDCFIHNCTADELRENYKGEQGGEVYVEIGSSNFAIESELLNSLQFKKEKGTCIGCPAVPKDSAWLKIGSTTHGAGANIIRKVRRGTKMVVTAGEAVEFMDGGVQGDTSGLEDFQLVKANMVKLARDHADFQPYIKDTAVYLNELIDQNRKVMVEGTQGSLLSLHHSYYPFCTSRDTNVSNWLMEAGLSPFVVERVLGVTRTFPIRVAGNSGPLSGQELTWEEVTEFACSPVPIEEITTATKRRRRVFNFGLDDFKKAIAINRPTELALTFVDYLHTDDYGKQNWSDLSDQATNWINQLENKTGVYFRWLSTGPNEEHTIDRGDLNTH